MSPTAEVALPYAEEMVGRLESELILLLVNEPQDHRSEHMIQCYLDYMFQKTKVGAIPFVKSSEYLEVEINTKILIGNPAEEIIKFTENQENCMIIMATHGQSGVDTPWPLGSVADKVVQYTTKPLGLIQATKDKPDVRKPIRLEKILAPLDGSKESEGSLVYIKNLASRLKAEVIFFIVSNPDKVAEIIGSTNNFGKDTNKIKCYLDNIIKDFNKDGVRATEQIKETNEDIAEEINKYTYNNRIDLVAMATHGWSDLQYWKLRSVTNKVLREGNAPIMIVRTASS